MPARSSPVVYVGPTLDAASIKRWLPSAQVMPPVRRGDLYRCRLIGFDVFVILDGVFFEQLAIPPREIIDVIKDGGIVFGASSMGALRAAECWPAGMHGVGTIYRLFRRGSLASDDEVAVAFVPQSPYRAVTVPLVNVRYAARRAFRRGLMTATESEQLVARACEQHFTQREWSSILNVDRSGIGMERLHAFLESQDLKALDGIRALKRVGSWIAGRRRAGRRSVLSTTLLSTPLREVPNDRIARLHRVRSPEVWRWLIATGRYLRYVHEHIGALASQPPLKLKRSFRGTRNGEAEVAAYIVAAARASFGPVKVDDVVYAASRRRSSLHVLTALWPQKGAAGRAVRAEIVAAGDTDALVLQFIAGSKAARLARESDWRPDGVHWYLARTEIAQNHGFRTWRDLEDAIGADKGSWTAIEQAAHTVALGKCVRQRLFTRDENIGHKGQITNHEHNHVTGVG